MNFGPEHYDFFQKMDHRSHDVCDSLFSKNVLDRVAGIVVHMYGWTVLWFEIKIKGSVEATVISSRGLNSTHVLSNVHVHELHLTIKHFSPYM